MSDLQTQDAIDKITAKIASALDESFSDAVLQLDKALASQTQTSAQVKIAHKSQEELAGYAQSRLEQARVECRAGLHDCKELQKELKDLETRVRRLKEKIRERWPVEYYIVRDEMDG